ncbi:MAG TPA: hypothetical protein VIF09_18365 [Polyangiaceae bacterium]
MIAVPRLGRLLAFGLLPLVAWAGAAACGDVIAQPIGAGPADGGGVEGASADAGGDSPVTPEGSPGGDASFCTGSGPIPIGTEQCTGDVARLFRFAACACNSLAVSGDLSTQSSLDGGSGSSASIAANGQVATNAQATVQGSVWAGGQALAAGTPAVQLSAPATTTSTVALDVQSGGDVHTSGTVLVGRNLYADGNVVVQSGSLSVVGAVHVPAGDTAAGVTAGGGIVNGPVQIPVPCDCSNPLDIAAIVAAHQSTNDDADGGITATSLDDPAGAVTLPCGLFYVDGIHGASAITIDVTGRAALFVGGDLDAEGGLTVTVNGGELDLFVAGNVTLKGTTSIGDPSAPSKTRIYMGGPTLTLTAAAILGANVYAPKADVQLASNFTMSGAFFAQSLQFSGFFHIYYDGDILQTPGCTPPGTSCKTCNDCPNATPACRAGTCAACTGDSDCCAPLRCDPGGTGRCVLPILQ